MQKLLVGSALLLAAVNSNAATYYVATTGNDLYSGTSSLSPWRTSNKAVSMAVAGDTVNVALGVYNEQVAFTKSGSAGALITFKGNGAIIDGTGVSIGNWGTLVNFSNVGYIHFE